MSSWIAKGHKKSARKSKKNWIKLNSYWKNSTNSLLYFIIPGESSEESQSDSGRNKSNLSSDPLDLKRHEIDLSNDSLDPNINTNCFNDLPDPERNNINSLEDESGQKNNNLFHASCESGKCLSAVEERKLLDWMHSCQERGQLLTKTSVSVSAKFIVYTSTKKTKRKHNESDFSEHICVSSQWLDKFFEKPICLQFIWSPSDTVYDLSEDTIVTEVREYSYNDKLQLERAIVSS